MLARAAFFARKRRFLAALTSWIDLPMGPGANQSSLFDIDHVCAGGRMLIVSEGVFDLANLWLASREIKGVVNTCLFSGLPSKPQ